MIDASLLQKLVSNTSTIQVLNLSCCDVDDDDVSLLCSVLRNNVYVHSLLLNWGGMTDKGISYLRLLLRHNQFIQRLELIGHPGISDVCIQTFLDEFRPRFFPAKGLRRLSINPYRNVRSVTELTASSEHDFLLKASCARVPFVVRGFSKKKTDNLAWTPAFLVEKLYDEDVQLTMHDFEKQCDQPALRLSHQKMKMQEAYSFLVEPCYTQSLTHRFYLQKQSIQRFKALQDSFALPDFCRVMTQDSYDHYFWFGQPDTHTFLHFDLYDNLFMQVSGRKSVILYAPEDSPYLFQTQPNKKTGFKDVHVSQVPYMDILDKHYEVTKHATPYHVCLDEGDILYIPSYWWHDIRGLAEPTISINYWRNRDIALIPEVQALICVEKWHSATRETQINDIVACVKTLIAYDCPNYMTHQFPFTLLQMAILFNIEEAVCLLLDHPHIQPNQASFHFSPLYLSIRLERLELFILLTRHKLINIHEPLSGTPYTPLTLAAECGYLTMIKHLLSLHVLPETKDVLGRTALMLATENNHIDCVNYLRTI